MIMFGGVYRCCVFRSWPDGRVSTQVTPDVRCRRHEQVPAWSSPGLKARSMSWRRLVSWCLRPVRCRRSFGRPRRYRPPPVCIADCC